MSKFNVGDKVKFLNQTGRGVVTKIISPVLVNVECEGFELPTLVKDIILDSTSNKAEKIFVSQFEEPKDIDSQSSNANNTNSDPAKEYFDSERMYFSSQGQQVAKGVYLAFAPLDQKWLIGSEQQIYLLNNTPHTIIYNIILKANDPKNDEPIYLGFDYGTLEPKHKILLATEQEKNLDRWLNSFVQIMFSPTEGKQVITPINYNLKVNGHKFFKQGCFVDTGLINEKCMLIDICLLDKVAISSDLEKEKIELSQKLSSLKELETKPNNKKEKKPKEESFFTKHLKDRTMAEVDLHIEELTDKPLLLTNSEIINLQMSYYKRCLDQAIELNLDKIIFIHGVGQGVLRHKIEEDLSKYPFIHFFAASMRDYGLGATEVLISKNRK